MFSVLRSMPSLLIFSAVSSLFFYSGVDFGLLKVGLFESFLGVRMEGDLGGLIEPFFVKLS